MLRKGSEEPGAWFRRAEDDLSAARLLLAYDGPLSIGAFHVQQALEKALKGFLISKGWTLRRIHNLTVLLNEASHDEDSLERWRELCEAANGFYLSERYPMEGGLLVEEAELAKLLDEADAMVAALKQVAWV